MYRQDLFPHVLAQLRSGKTNEEASEKLNELVRACQDTGKKGKITLTMEVKPDDGDTGQYFVTDKIELKKPEPTRGKTILFGTPEGNLQRTDPNQQEMVFVRDIDQKEPPWCSKAN